MFKSLAHLAQLAPELMTYTGNYGATGYTGYIGTNAHFKKHFNKKRHGRMLRKKHRKQ